MSETSASDALALCYTEADFRVICKYMQPEKRRVYHARHNLQGRRGVARHSAGSLQYSVIFSILYIAM